MIYIAEVVSVKLNGKKIQLEDMKKYTIDHPIVNEIIIRVYNRINKQNKSA